MVSHLWNNLRRGEKTGTHITNFIQAMQDVFFTSFQVLQSLRLSSAQESCCSLKWACSFQDFSGIISSVLCHVVNSFQPQKLCWEISAEVTVRLKLSLGWAASISFSQARNCLNHIKTSSIFGSYSLLHEGAVLTHTEVWVKAAPSEVPPKLVNVWRHSLDSALDKKSFPFQQLWRHR